MTNTAILLGSMPSFVIVHLYVGLYFVVLVMKDYVYFVGKQDNLQM